MNIIICGSIAYDTIMSFEDKFKNHILKDEIDTLNVAFLTPDMRREFGGCAGNIAYNLKMLGEIPLIMATVGKDHDPYSSRLKKWGISLDHVKVMEDEYTAQAFITTDLDGNQITAFHPGAMNHSAINHIKDAPRVSLGIVSPDGREGMLRHAKEFFDNNIPFIFDPGQGLPMFSKNELLEFINMATYVATNDYEAKLLVNKTGKSLKQIANIVDAFVLTKGEKGSLIFSEGACHEIPPIKVSNAVDPTGCGDAYRAGLIFGILNKMDWEKTGRLSSLLGAIKIGSQGPQNHKFDYEEISNRFNKEFGHIL